MADEKSNQKQLPQRVEVFQGFKEFWSNLFLGVINFFKLIGLLLIIGLVCYSLWWCYINPIELIAIKAITILLVLASIYFSITIILVTMALIIDRVSKLISNLFHREKPPTPQVIYKKEVENTVFLDDKQPVAKIIESRGVDEKKKFTDYDFKTDMLSYAGMSHEERRNFPQRYIDAISIDDEIKSMYDQETIDSIIRYYASDEFRNHEYVKRAEIEIKRNREETAKAIEEESKYIYEWDKKENRQVKKLKKTERIK